MRVGLRVGVPNHKYLVQLFHITCKIPKRIQFFWFLFKTRPSKQKFPHKIPVLQSYEKSTKSPIVHPSTNGKNQQKKLCDFFFNILQTFFKFSSFFHKRCLKRSKGTPKLGEKYSLVFEIFRKNMFFLIPSARPSHPSTSSIPQYKTRPCQNKSFLSKHHDCRPLKNVPDR